MKKNKTVISVMLLSLAATSAVAEDRDDDDRGCRGDDDHRCLTAAPEIDLAQGLNALVLLAGAVAIFRASRVRKNPA